MKVLKSLIMGISVFSLISLLSSPSFADWKLKADEIKTLRDSSTALEQSNQDLSKSLTEYADQAEKVRNESVENYQKGKEERENHIKLLRDSAEALKESNPELSERLKQIADEKEKWWEKNMSQGGEESEEE